jgi:hypothetical protein
MRFIIEGRSGMKWDEVRETLSELGREGVK